jgi:hypothetical protein
MPICSARRRSQSAAAVGIAYQRRDRGMRNSASIDLAETSVSVQKLGASERSASPSEPGVDQGRPSNRGWIGIDWSHQAQRMAQSIRQQARQPCA